MKINLNYTLIIACICSVLPLAAQNATGTWKTVDDRDGTTKAIIVIHEEDGRLYGHVKEILEKGNEKALCTECDGELKNKPVTGMRIINGLKQEGDGVWEGGKKSLFDPEQGRYFRAKIWLDPHNPNKLKVRGYLLFLFRTQTWLRITDPS